jgi:transcriptional regulator with XRE-family HTH domain
MKLTYRYNHNRIKELIDSKQLKQKDFAELLKVSTPFISQMLREKNVRTDTLEKIAESLDVEVMEFYTDENGYSLQRIYDNLAENNSILKTKLEDEMKEVEALLKTIEDAQRIIYLQQKVIDLVDKQREIKGET